MLGRGGSGNRRRGELAQPSSFGDQVVTTGARSMLRSRRGRMQGGETVRVTMEVRLEGGGGGREGLEGRFEEGAGE